MKQRIDTIFAQVVGGMESDTGGFLLKEIKKNLAKLIEIKIHASKGNMKLESHYL